MKSLKFVIASPEFIEGRGNLVAVMRRLLRSTRNDKINKIFVDIFCGLMNIFGWLKQPPFVIMKPKTRIFLT